MCPDDLGWFLVVVGVAFAAFRLGDVVPALTRRVGPQVPGHSGAVRPGEDSVTPA